MYKAHLISADFEESTMEFEIEHEFTAKKGDYVIMEKSEFESLSEKANGNHDPKDSDIPITKAFERDVFHLINEYVKKGLSKPDLVGNMEYITESCRKS